MSIRYATATSLLIFLLLVAPVFGQQTGTDRLVESLDYPAKFEHLEVLSSKLDRAAAEVRDQRPTSVIEADLTFQAVAAPQEYLIVGQLSQGWDAEANSGAGDWFNENRVTFSRESDGFQTELLIEDWDADAQAWVPSARRVSSRDANTLVTLDESWDPDANGGEGDWAPAQRRTSTLNAQGNTLQSTTEIWDEDTGDYFIWFRSTNTYDASGTQVETLVSESALFGPLAPSLRYTFTYNNDGTTASRLFESYDRDTGEFGNAGFDQYTYDSNGERIEDLELDWDEDAGDWVNSFRTTTDFTPDSQNPTMIVETDQSWDEAAGDWLNEEREISSLDGNDVTVINQEWDADAGDWVNTEQSITTLTPLGPAQEIEQEWDGTAWVNTERFTVEFDDRGLVISGLNEVWDGTDWVNESLLTQTYEDFDTSGPVAVEDDALSLGYELHSTYPNPFSATTTIRFTLPESDHVTLEVFDALGRRVRTLVDTRLSAGTHSVVLEARDLPGGLYLYRLGNQRVELTRTMLLVN